MRRRAQGSESAERDASTPRVPAKRLDSSGDSERGRRKADDDARTVSAPVPRRELQSCLMSLGHFVDDRQPQTRAIAGRALDAIEPLEHPSMGGFGDARSGIFNAQVRLTKLRAAAYGDRPTPGRVAKGVVQEIVEQFPEQRRISRDMRVLEHEAEIDVTGNRALYPFVDRAVRDRT